MKDKFAFIVARGFYCHTSLRFGPCNQIYDDEYTEFQIALRYFEMYPQVVFNDPCIKSTIMKEFWDYVSGRRLVYSSFALAGILLASLFI